VEEYEEEVEVKKIANLSFSFMSFVRAFYTDPTKLSKNIFTKKSFSKIFSFFQVYQSIYRQTWL